jgi:hypothetical protein
LQATNIERISIWLFTVYICLLCKNTAHKEFVFINFGECTYDWRICTGKNLLIEVWVRLSPVAPLLRVIPLRAWLIILFSPHLWPL